MIGWRGAMDCVLVSGCLALAAAAVPHRVEAAGWADSRVLGPFVCRADFALAGSEAYFDGLGSLQSDLVESLGIAPAKEPIEIYLFHDKATYTRYMSRYLPQAPSRRALYVKSQGPGRGRVFAYWSRDFDVDLRHECTHALLHASLPLVPLWLDEGLAQFFEVPSARRAADHPNLNAVRWNLKWSQPPKLEPLENKTEVSEMGRAEYRDSWAWVHFLLLGPAEARSELRAYLADLEHNTPPGRLNDRVAARVPNLQKQFTEHFRKQNRR